MNNLVADRLLMVYDMRVMRAMAPIQVSIDPTFLRFVPTLSNHLIVVSQVIMLVKYALSFNIDCFL